jgi:hypothetical protein
MSVNFSCVINILLLQTQIWIILSKQMGNTVKLVLKIIDFWNVLAHYWCFRRMYWLHLRGADSSNLKVEVVHCSKTSGTVYHTTWHCIPQYSNFHGDAMRNLTKPVFIIMSCCFLQGWFYKFIFIETFFISVLIHILLK